MLTAAEIADRLEARRNGNGWKARCPAHDSRSGTSLSITEGEDGRPLLFGHCGCTTDAICAAMGISKKDLMPPSSNGHHHRRNGKAHTSLKPRAKTKSHAYATLDDAIKGVERQTGGQCVKRWSYTDHAGAIVGVVARFNLPTEVGRKQRKTFRPFHPEGGKWYAADPKRKWPVYGIPAQRTYLVEGEHCADVIRSTGLAAVTSAHGADGTDLTDWSGIPSGTEIIALPDNDAKGESYVGKAAAILRERGCKVRIVHLREIWLDLPEGGDVADMIGDGGPWAEREDDDMRAALEELANAAPELTDATPSSKGRRPVLKRLSDIAPEQIRWEWEGVIPRGGLTGLVGDPGQGKSLCTIDLAARVSTGSGWPDAPGRRFGPGGVLFVTAEDALASVVRPRLDAAGADTSRIHALDAVAVRGPDGKATEMAFNLADDDVLETAIDETPECKLVIIDPISAFMGDSDSNSNSETRALLRPLHKLAEQRGISILLVSHLRKSEGRALHRALGSIGFMAACRVAWGVTRDQQDTDEFRRIVVPLKNNYAPDRRGLAYRIVAPVEGQHPCLAWEPDRVNMDADTLMNGVSARPGPDDDEHQRACEWLQVSLAPGPRLASEMVEEAREGEGISKRTLDRARKTVGVKSYRPHIPGPWWWRLNP